jgi:hypothetical protein
MPFDSASRAAKIAAILVAACLPLPLLAGKAYARDPVAPPSEGQQPRAVNIEGVSRWLQGRFSEAELEALRPEELRVESHYCSCEDTPVPHYPYTVVLFLTPRGALVARPEGREGAVMITPLAVRHDTRYCEVESEGSCYGSFANPCEFTDFRYGQTLAQFFPSCKSEHAAGLLRPAVGGE